jgi:hypothetical protein
MAEAQSLSKDAKMAMFSQFLGFMLDAYDAAFYRLTRRSACGPMSSSAVCD